MKQDIYNQYSCSIALQDYFCNPYETNYRYIPSKDSTIQKMNKEMKLRQCQKSFEFEHKQLIPTQCGPYL